MNEKPSFHADDRGEYLDRAITSDEASLPVVLLLPAFSSVDAGLLSTSMDRSVWQSGVEVPVVIDAGRRLKVRLDCAETAR